MNPLKTALVTSAILLLAPHGFGQAGEINVLFMGNSFTFRSDLPELVKEVFEEGQPDLAVNVEKVVYGGQDLFRHHDVYFSETMVRLNTITIPEIEAKKDTIKQFLAAKEPPAFYQAYWEKTGLRPEEWSKLGKRLDLAVMQQDRLISRINNGRRKKWDYLVLQSWLDVTEDVDSGYGEYARKFAELAEKEGTKVVLYITAPHAQNQSPVSEPVKPEQTEREMKTIGKLAELLKPHAVVPVALGIKRVQEDGTDIRFRYANDFHPNQYCAYLTANMFYAAFFRESPLGLGFDTVVENNTKGNAEGKDPDNGDAKVVFEDPVKSLLQKAAFDGVTDFNSQYLPQ